MISRAGFDSCENRKTERVKLTKTVEYQEMEAVKKAVGYFGWMADSVTCIILKVIQDHNGYQRKIGK